MSEPFRVSRRVEFHETDMAGIAHFSNFFRWMEWGEREFLRARGLSFRIEWEGEQLGFPRVSASCDYLSPVEFDDVIEVAVRVENVGRKSVTYAFEFTSAGRAVARGRISAVCCRVAGGRLESVEIPASLRARLLGQ
jgi:YbgC/YbaW family acyl-CoA thioester hydrolase